MNVAIHDWFSGSKCSFALTLVFSSLIWLNGGFQLATFGVICVAMHADDSCALTNNPTDRQTNENKSLALTRH